MKSLDGIKFDVSLWPRHDVDKKLHTGDGVPMHRIKNPDVAVDGSQFELDIDPSTVPKTYVNDDGTVNVNVDLLSKGNLVGSVSKTVSMLHDETGASTWVDARSRLAQQAGGPKVARLANEQARAPKATVGIVQPGARPTGTGGTSSFKPVRLYDGACKLGDEYKLMLSKPKWSSLGETSVPDGTKSTAYAGHSMSRSHTLGVATTIGAGDSEWKWGESVTSAAGVSFTWAKNSATWATYQAVVNYGLYYTNKTLDNDGTPTGGCWNVSRQWRPRYHTGGYRNVTPTSGLPGWKYSCAPVPAGEWKRQDSNSHEYESEMDFSRQGVDLYLDSNRQYASDAFIAYNIVGKKKLCGDDSDPAHASNVRMAKTW